MISSVIDKLLLAPHSIKELLPDGFVRLNLKGTFEDMIYIIMKEIIIYILLYILIWYVLK
jgi:hypothetical protein